MSCCHSLVDGAPSIYSLDHWQCYQKACYIVRNNAPKLVLTPPLLPSCTFLRLLLILLFSRAVPALSLSTGGRDAVLINYLSIYLSIYLSKCKLSLSLALLYLVDLFIYKLKTKFNNLFLQNDFKYK